MAKSDFNNSVFVVKVYEHTTPSIHANQPLNKGIINFIPLSFLINIQRKPFKNYKPININNYESKSRL